MLGVFSSSLANVGNHTLFIKSDGSLWGMGSNSHGQLGTGDFNDRNTAQELVSADSSNPIIEITHGYNHTLFLRKDGSLWAMGMNNFGQLGDGSTTHRSSPVRIVESGVVRISAGYFHSLFLKSNGSLWGMGSNTCGELGINLAGGSNSSFDSGIDQKSPIEIISSGVAQMSGGRFFTLFVKFDGSLWGMGEAHDGRLGQPWVGGSNNSYDSSYDKKVPVRIIENDVIETEAGAQFSLIRKKDGSAWSFGSNWNGMLADGKITSSRIEPYRFLEANVTQIAASWSFGGVLLKNGSLQMFGGNFSGQLGDGTTIDRNETTEIISSGVSQFSTASGHTMIIKDNGSLWTVGSGEFGQLGNSQSGGTHQDFDEGIDTKTFSQVISSGATHLPNFHEFDKPNHFADMNTSVDLEMVWVEPGIFTMGSPVTEIGRNSSETEHNVTLTRGFYLGKYEVTQAQYEAVMKSHSDANATPSRWSGHPNRPVEKISWNDIQLFLELLNEQETGNIPAGWKYILPTEAQWEYACRAGTSTSYSWGNTISDSDANWMNTNDDNQTQNVGQYNANPWGFFDMHGNVWEWTNDWKASYSENNVTDPKGPDMGSQKIVRGGSYSSHSSYVRSARRHSYETNATFSGIGFRLALLNANHAPSFHEKNATFSIQENQTTYWQSICHRYKPSR
jgi:formylglycine-generating enzyme required for sulfatase activity/alpha-tubulin suppressor-like RCC1 family protein